MALLQEPEKMRFERGKDPKKALGIGIGSKSLWMKAIYEKVEDENGVESYQIINGPDGHRILKDIQKNGFHNRHIPYYINNGRTSAHFPIGWWRGNWVEYLKTYYFLPKINP